MFWSSGLTAPTDDTVSIDEQIQKQHLVTFYVCSAKWTIYAPIFWSKVILLDSGLRKIYSPAQEGVPVTLTELTLHCFIETVSLRTNILVWIRN